MGNTSANRTGRVSSVDYERGTYEVTYWDRGGSVTRKVNGVANGIYKMPRVGQVVTVSHNSNGAEAAVSAGNVWNASNSPVQGKKGLFRQDFGDTKGRAYQCYDEATGTHQTCVDKLMQILCNGDIYQQAKGALKLISSGAMSLASLAGTASVTGKAGVAISSGQSVDVEAAGGWSLSALEESEETFGAGLRHTVEGDSESTVKGNCTSIAEGNKETTVQGDYTLNLDGDFTMNLKGDLKILLAGAQITVTQAGDIEIVSRQLKANNENIELEALGGSVKVDGVSLTKHLHKEAGAGEPEKEGA